MANFLFIFIHRFSGMDTRGKSSRPRRNRDETFVALETWSRR